MDDNPFFKKYANDYSKSKSHRYGEDLKILVSMIPENLDLCLDVATGTGFTAVEISKNCKNVIALDETENMLSKARELMNDKNIKNISFVKSSFESYVTDLKFDLITIRRAFHHFKDKNFFMEKAHELLKNGGFLIIADMLAPDNDIDDNFNRLERIRDETHVGALRLDEYISLAKEHGFSILSLKTNVEKLSFINWLYPVKMESETGKKCFEFIKSLNNDELLRIGFDINSMSINKKRIIIKMEKQ